MPQVNLDPKTYDLVKAIARRDDRLLKGVVRTAVEAVYGASVAQESITEEGPHA